MHNITCITSGPYILVRANILPAESVKNLGVVMNEYSRLKDHVKSVRAVIIIFVK